MSEKFKQGDRVSLKDGVRYERPLEQCVGVVDVYENYHGVRVWIEAEDGLYYAYAEDDLVLVERKKTALTKMVNRLDSRNKRTSSGYVTNRDELIAILGEVSKLVSVSIVEEERPYAVQHKEISVIIKLGLTLERDLL